MPVVTVEYRQGIAEICIRREASLNALDADVLGELSDILSDLHEECEGDAPYQRCRVVTIRGEGEKAFVAGADIKLMKSASQRELTKFISLGQRVMRQIELLPLPVIAVVHGFAIGGGLELALACDFIIGTEKTKVGQAEVNLGLIPGFGGTQRLLHRVGIGAAKRLILTGETISGEEANKLGLFDWYVNSSALDESVKKICETLLLKAPQAIASGKRSIERAIEQAKLSGLTREVEDFVELFSTADTQEGLNAFIEKRKPTFIGK